MPRVLIIGATGYIGEALALELLRSGNHTVYGAARNEAKAKSLAALEILPVIAADPANQPEPLLAAIAQHRIDTVVVAGVNDGFDKLRDVIVQAGKAKRDAAAKAGVAFAPKLGLVYVSGIWVHGSDRDNAASDLDSVGTALSPKEPVGLVAWRAEIEKTLLAQGVAEVLDVVVVRSALVYGRGSAIWTALFDKVLEAAKNRAPSVQVPLVPDSRPILIHVDDVASGLAKVVDRVPEISGGGSYPVFDLAGQSEPMVDIFAKFAQVVGYTGKIELVGPGDNAFAAAMGASAINRSERAKILLGWQPKRAGLVDGMEQYAKAFVANKAA